MFRDLFSVFERLISNMVPVTNPSFGSDCWTWTKGVCNKNYGFLYIYNPRTKKSDSRRAHIVSWAIANQRLPGEGMTLDHLCRNTRCIRPSHLEEVSRPENTRRGNAAR